MSRPAVSQLVNQYELASQTKSANEDVRHHGQSAHCPVSNETVTVKALKLLGALT